MRPLIDERPRVNSSEWNEMFHYDWMYGRASDPFSQK